MSFSVEAITTNLAWGVNVAQESAVYWGGYAVAAIHEAVSGPVVAQISNLFASTAGMGPYAGPAIVGGATLVTALAAYKLWNSVGRVSQVAGLALACAAGLATTATVGVAMGAVSAAAYIAGGTLTAAVTLL